MFKQNFIIRKPNLKFETVSGYLTLDGVYGVDKRGSKWFVTDIATGMGIDSTEYSSRKDAIADIKRLEGIIAEQGIRESDGYIQAVEELNEYIGVKTESEDKTMAKTNKDTKAKTETASKGDDKYEKLLKDYQDSLKLVAEMSTEIQALKSKLEMLETVETSGIDEFDVEKYLATRDNTARITPELVKAFENTKGLTVERKGKDGWLYVSGKTEADTKDRKDIFKTMGFRWSAPEKAWFLAPYPLRSKNSWGAKKARMATA